MYYVKFKSYDINKSSRLTIFYCIFLIVRKYDKTKRPPQQKKANNINSHLLIE